MATTNRNPTSITYTGKSTFGAELASLRAAIQSGNTIYANDLNRIGTLINNMNGHYHTYLDWSQAATYGNTGDRNIYSRNSNTLSIDSTTTAPTDTATNTMISASRHNELQVAINNIRTHLHTIDDKTSGT